jgi:hypothetical protein
MHGLNEVEHEPVQFERSHILDHARSPRGPGGRHSCGGGTTVTELRYINWRRGAAFFMATAVIRLAVALGLRVAG